MRHAWTMLVAVFGILGACASEPASPNRLVVTATGAVRDAHSAAPISGAVVELYRISNYTTVTLDRDTTDAAGLYQLSTYSCADGIDVAATGYYDHFFALVQVQCVEEPQIRDIYLDPDPVRLIVTPQTLTLQPGEQQRFDVSATFADGSSGPPPPYGPWPPPYGADWDVAWRVAGDSTCGWIVGPKTGASVEYVAPVTGLSTLCGTSTVGQVVIFAGVVIWGVVPQPANDSAIVTISP